MLRGLGRLPIPQNTLFFLIKALLHRLDLLLCNKTIKTFCVLLWIVRFIMNPKMIKRVQSLNIWYTSQLSSLYSDWSYILRTFRRFDRFIPGIPVSLIHFQLLIYISCTAIIIYNTGEIRRVIWLLFFICFLIVLHQLT
jgi:hypothetical protein